MTGGYSQHDAAIWHTQRIHDAVVEQRWDALPSLATPFPPRLAPGERILTCGPFELMTFRPVGDGTYQHSSGFFFATGGAGLAATAAFAGAQAVGNSARRRAAELAAVPRWVVDDHGTLLVSTHGFYLDTPAALLPWDWESVVAVEVCAPALIRVRGESTGGPVHWLVRCDWAELVFVLWALRQHPGHPQLAGRRWVPPGWSEREAARTGSVPRQVTAHRTDELPPGG